MVDSQCCLLIGKDVELNSLEGITMPYLLISTQIRLENGPTHCGDALSDERLMSYLGAVKKVEAGNTFQVFISESPPRVILNKLDKVGYRVICMAGVGQTCSWTLYAEKEMIPDHPS